MSKQIEFININEPIYSDGIGDLKLGLNIFFLRKIYLKSLEKNNSISLENTSDWRAEFNDPYMQNLTFYYKEILEIDCNIFLGKISRITFKSGYQGKLWNKVGIGDRVGLLFEHNEINGAKFGELNDGLLFFYYKNRFQLDIKISDEYLDYVDTNDELMDYDIKEISIYDDNLRIAIGLLDFPDSWKNSSPYTMGLESE